MYVCFVLLFFLFLMCEAHAASSGSCARGTCTIECTVQYYDSIAHTIRLVAYSYANVLALQLRIFKSAVVLLVQGGRLMTDGRSFAK